MPDHPSHEESKFYTVNPGESDPKAWSTLVIGTVGILLAWVVIMGLEVIYHKTARAEFERKIVNSQPAELTQSRAEQLQQINGYHWIDESAGTVSIPVERAMQLMVEEDVERRSQR